MDRRLQGEKVDALLIDLRGNTGGLLQEAITLSGLFFARGPVVQFKDASRNVKPFDDIEELTAWEGPFVVLIDRRSASGAEIFAAAIKDYGRGLLIGDASTFGVGTIQTLFVLADQLKPRSRAELGTLKLTTAQFYRVNGDSTQVHGITPDLHIPSIRDLSEPGEAKRENALKFDRVPGLSHDQYNRVPSDLVATLALRSWDRRKASPKFQLREKGIRLYAERQARQALSLNEAKFREAWTLSRDDPDRDPDEAAAKGPKTGENPPWEANAYNDEVLAIVADYLTLGAQALAALPIRARSTVTIHLVNTDKTYKVYLKGGANNDIMLDPGATRSEAMTVPGHLMYYSGDDQSKRWVTLPLSRGGTLKFRLGGGIWTTQFE